MDDSLTEILGISGYTKVDAFAENAKPEFVSFMDMKDGEGSVIRACRETKTYTKEITRPARKPDSSPIMEDGSVDWGHPAIWEY